MMLNEREFEVTEFPTRTVSWWYQRRNSIDFDPPYQRKSLIWNQKDKAYLIDSILNGYDIPKFYIADFLASPNNPLNLQRKQYAVIDGKQRFETLLDFREGRVVLDRRFFLEEDRSLRLGGLGYNDLKQNYAELAERFDNFNLSVMRVVTSDESRINALFVRLNRNKPLTGAEVRNAMEGIVPELVRSLSNHAFFKDNIRFGTRRQQDRNLAAKLLLLEFRGEVVTLKKTNLDRLVEEINELGVQADAQIVDMERAADRVADVLDRMSRIFVASDELLSSEGPVPLYYWFIRDLEPVYDGRVRAFLVNLERDRQRNRAISADPATQGQADPVLLRYDSLSRSPNDAATIEGMFDILHRLFWAGTPRVATAHAR